MRYWLMQSVSSGNVYVVELATGNLLCFVLRWGRFYEVLKTGPFSSPAEARVAQARRMEGR